jgi:hypothetical protein
MRIERFAEMLSDWPVADRRKFAELLGRFASAFESSK